MSEEKPAELEEALKVMRNNAGMIREMEKGIADITKQNKQIKDFIAAKYPEELIRAPIPRRPWKIPRPVEEKEVFGALRAIKQPLTKTELIERTAEIYERPVESIEKAVKSLEEKGEITETVKGVRIA